MVEHGGVGSPHIDEGTIHAWLDDALSAEDSAVVQSHVAHCSTCAAAVAEARGLIAASTRILSALDDVPAGVIPAHGAPRRVSHVGRTGLSVRRYAPIAAVAAFAIAATLVMRRNTMGTQAAVSVVEQKHVTSVGAASVQPDARATSIPAIHPLPEHRGAHKSVSASASTAPVAAAPSPPPVLPSAAAGVTDASASQKAVAANARELRVVSDLAFSPHANDSLAITGRVVAATTGRPLALASVVVLGTTAGAMTDSTGVFTIAKLPPGAHTLVARKIGFAAAREDVSVPADRSASVTLSLPQSTTQLSEVVVNGAATTPDSGRFTELPPTITGARLVSSERADDNGMPVRRTVYEIGAGARITLVESRSIRANALSGSRAAATVFVAPRVFEKAGQQQMHSVSWVAGDGTSLVLSGTLSVAELEAFRNQVVR